MKNKLLGTASILAIAVLAVINVQFTELVSANNQLELSKLVQVAHAQAEYGGWDNFWQGQGFYLDEAVFPVTCSGTSGGSVKVCVKKSGAGACIEWSYQSAGPTTALRCQYGSANCSPTGC